MVASVDDLGYLPNIGDEFGTEWLHKHGDRDWPRNNTSFSNYTAAARFPTLEGSIYDALYDNVRSGDAILDLAGGNEAYALQELLNNRIGEYGLVTNLEDSRSQAVRADSRIAHISGSLLLSSTWRQIAAWQQNNARQGFGVIVHRPDGGLQGFPANYYERGARMLLHMLRPGGIFFTQIPRVPAEQATLLKSVIERLGQSAAVRELHLDNDPPSYALLFKADK